MTTAHVRPTLTAEIAARVERLPMSRWHVKVRLLIGIVTFFDAFDQLLIAYVLPVIRDEWNMSSFQSTFAITSGAIGLLVGALLSGWIADRIGRVPTIVVTLLVYALAGIALALAPSLEFFLVMRFIQGVGIGGQVPVAATYIGEITKAAKRGRFVLMYELIFPIGLATAAIVATFVVPAFGWRWLFAIGALPLLLVPFLATMVPESPRWLAGRGQRERAEETMARIERDVERATGEPLPPADIADVKADTLRAGEGRGGIRELFAGRYARRTLTLWVLWFSAYFVLYGMNSWMPTIYHTVYDVPLDDSLKYSVVPLVAGIIGCLVVALTIDRFGRRPTLATVMITGGLVLGLLGALGATSVTQVFVLISLAAVFINGANLSLYLYTPELYPTRSRALGVSLGGVWNRVGVISGPILIGFIYVDGTAPVFVMLGAVAIAGGLVAALFAQETARRTLEEISP
ncbi:MFS transporter [Actinomadura sp. WMMB 499]|uniref:MFS transporter n=1 Tax=Actinomadura sp. WMMB 499 TaxID=1219491 RepID=UPI001248FE4A|nr:MFS transporter [Actinomadura sp. WMMB 499]QFG23606.1 MFS transporter [Actinomadura sp. WMMB 499]